MRRVSIAAFHVYFILEISSHVRTSPVPLLSAISSCSASHRIWISHCCHRKLVIETDYIKNWNHCTMKNGIWITLTLSDFGEDMWLICEVADHEGDKSRGGTMRTYDNSHDIVYNVL